MWVSRTLSSLSRDKKAYHVSVESKCANLMPERPWSRKITLLLSLAHTGILGCVCYLQKASPASLLLLLRPLFIEEQQQLEDCLKHRSLDPTLDLEPLTSFTRVPKPVGSLQRALVEPPELEWVEMPQTREKTLLLSPFSTRLSTALQL